MFTRFIARQKYRFDIGQGFLTVVNFTFIVLAASDKLVSLTGIELKLLVPVLIPSALLAVWLLGYCLDRLRFIEAYQSEQNKRNEMLTEVHRSTQPK